MEVLSNDSSSKYIYEHFSMYSLEIVHSHFEAAETIPVNIEVSNLLAYRRDGNRGAVNSGVRYTVQIYLDARE